MKRLTKKILVIVMVLCLGTVVSASGMTEANQVVSAHSGRTDSNGGHRDNKNKSGLGSYHYHCGGHPAHLHKNGVCPYKKSSSTSSNTSKTTIKKVQTKLNKLGYNCGKADGKLGTKTRNAIKKYEKKKGLKVDGLITVRLRKSLGLL